MNAPAIISTHHLPVTDAAVNIVPQRFNTVAVSMRAKAIPKLRIVTGSRRPPQGWTGMNCPKCGSASAYLNWTHYQDGAELWCSNGHQVAQWLPEPMAQMNFQARTAGDFTVDSA